MWWGTCSAAHSSADSGAHPAAQQLARRDGLRQGYRAPLPGTRGRSVGGAGPWYPAAGSVLPPPPPDAQGWAPFPAAGSVLPPPPPAAQGWALVPSGRLRPSSPRRPLLRGGPHFQRNPPGTPGTLAGQDSRGVLCGVRHDCREKPVSVDTARMPGEILGLFLGELSVPRVGRGERHSTLGQVPSSARLRGSWAGGRWPVRTSFFHVWGGGISGGGRSSEISVEVTECLGVGEKVCEKPGQSQ